MLSVRWYLRWARIYFMCWYAGHRWLEDANARVCTRCFGAAEWL